MPKIPSRVLREQEAQNPTGLQPFIFHGAELRWGGSSEEAIGQCVFCGKEDKFYVNVQTTKWQCFSCGETGNALIFLRKFWEECDRGTSDYSTLMEDRGLLSLDTCVRWGCVKSILTGEWLLPAYDAKQRLHQLYRWVPIPTSKGEWRRRLLPTPGVHTEGHAHGMFGSFPLDLSRTKLLVCEGPWDGMILWEALQGCEEKEEQPQVLATPGCNVFSEPWCSLFAGKDVSLLFDNDHPKKNPRTGKLLQAPAYAGARRTARILDRENDDSRPKSIRWLKWSDGKGTYSPELPDGYDVRDYFSQGAMAGERLELVRELLEKIVAAPTEWFIDNVRKERVGESRVEMEPCTSWDELVLCWQKALEWTPNLERTLAVILAAIISTDTVGQQLWVRVMGPPATGKTTLCEAIGVARRWVYAKDTFTGLMSGYQTDKEGSENLSMVQRLNGKTLVINDADTVLNLPNREQIMSQLRAFYSRNIRSQYGNKMSKDWEGISTTVVLCGTSEIRKLDAAELGARYIDVVVMGKIEPDFERQVNRAVFQRAMRNVKVVVNGKPETKHDALELKAMRKTGGYVDYLRNNADLLLSEVEVTDEQGEFIIACGEFAAVMRARPSGKQSEIVERELSARIVEQFTRLAACLVAVTGKRRADDYVLEMIRRTAIDTSSGRILDVTRGLYDCGRKGAHVRQVGVWLGEGDEKAHALLSFLRKIEVVEYFVTKLHTGLKSNLKWRLTDRVRNLYEEVMQRAEDTEQSEE